MRWAWLVLALAACGRLGFDDLGGDAGAGAGGPGSGSGGGGTPRVISTADVSADGVATVTLPLWPQAGDVLVIGVATYSGTSFVKQISDDGGNTYASALARAVSLVDSSSSEIWYGPVTTGAKRLTVSLSEASGATVWVAELAGVAPAPPAVAFGAAAPGSMVPGPPAVVIANAFVFSVLRLDDGHLESIHTGNPFNPLGIVDAQNAAYVIAPAAGTYRAEWDASAVAGACGSTAAFLPL